MVATSHPPAKTRTASPQRRITVLYALVAIAVGYQILVTQVPFAITIYLSLTHWNLLFGGAPRWVGLHNYQYLIDQGTLWADIGRTIVLTVGTVAGAGIVGIVLALMLLRTFPGKGIVRTLLMTPFLVMTPVIAIIWKDMLLDPLYGFVNAFLHVFGVGPINFLGRWPMGVIIAMGIWQWAPFVMLIVDAGLHSIDLEIFDAVAVDGATGWQRVWHIYLPLVLNHIAVSLMLASILILPTFGKIFMTTAGGPGQDTTNLTWAVYHQVFQGYNIGQGSAWAMVSALVTVIAVVVLLSRIRIRSIGGSS